MSELQERLDEIALLQDNWDGYRTPAPNTVALQNAHQIAEILEAFGISPYRVAASVVGGVGFTCESPNGKAYVECDNDSEIWIALYGNGMQTKSWRLKAVPSAAVTGEDG